MVAPSSPPPPGASRPPAPQKKSGNWIILLAIVGGVVFFVGPCAAFLAVSGVRKYIVNAKGAEARSTLRQISQLAAAAIDRDGKPCPSASAPVPADIKYVRGSRYASSPGDWKTDASKSAGFACLGFSMSLPQYYQYEYRATADSFEVTARGDLDGDGNLATFVMRGSIVAGKGTFSPDIQETDAME